MASRYELRPVGKAWHVMARKGAGAATEASWLSLGSCTSQVAATDVYLALKAREGR